MVQQLLESPYVFVLGILLITVAVPVVVHHWHATRRAELDAALKQDMLQRGMTAEEIKMVLESRSDRTGRPGPSCRTRVHEAGVYDRRNV